MKILEICAGSIESAVAARDGGAMGAVLNAADEVATTAFLSGRISFTGISDTVSAVYEKMSYAKNTDSIDGIIAIDTEARKVAGEIVSLG